MARTAVTITTLTAEAANASVLTTDGVAIDATNSHVITPPAGCMLEELLLRVTNTTASTKTATVKAGSNPPSQRAGSGDLVLSLTDGSSTSTHTFVPLSSSRFSQATGVVNVDIEAAMTGRIACYRLPRNV
jgi:hypothetical protein